ncbi:hypothetical protein GCM10010199_25830 [Dactylosporangium roseum]
MRLKAVKDAEPHRENPGVAQPEAGEERAGKLPRGPERRSLRPATALKAGQPRGGSFTTLTKNSSIWRTTAMKLSKSTGLVT